MLFGRLRDELWQLEHRWVVAVQDDERSIMLAPPADAFFEQVVALELAPAALRELHHAREPGLPEDVLRRIARLRRPPAPRCRPSATR